MDFHTEDDEFSTPCLLIESSQVEEPPISLQMDADPLCLRFLNKNINTAGLRLTKGDFINTSREPDDIKVINAFSGSGGGNNKKSSSNNDTSNNDNTQRGQHGQAQTSSTSGFDAGGGEGGGGDDGDDRRQDRRMEPDACNESTEHSENSGSSSVPELIPAADKQPSIGCGQDGSFSSDSNPSIKLNTSSSSSSSAERSRHETYSQASTALADEMYQSRLESSEEGIPQLKKKSSSSSSSMGKSKSDTSSSSIYPTSNASSFASSLSSDGSPSYHPQLDAVKEDSEEKDYVCSQDMFADKEDSNAISSQEVSRISTPQDRSTPVESKQVKVHGGPDLYKQVLTRTSTPLGSQDVRTPPSHEGFNCLQFSGSSSECPKSDVSAGSFIEAPLIVPSSPTELVVKYTSSAAGSYSSSEIINPSPNSFHFRTETLSSTPDEQTTSHSSEKHSDEHSTSLVKDQQAVTYTSASTAESSEIINPSPDSFQCRAATLSSTPEEDGVTTNPSDKPIQKDEDIDDEFNGLPQWQQDILARQKEKVSTTSTSSEGCTSSSTSYNVINDESEDQEAHPWQSVMDSSKLESATLREKPTTVKHVTFLMDKSQSQSEPNSNPNIAESEDKNDSLSPSSLVIDEQCDFAKIVSPKNKQKMAGCSQPEMSEDLFYASTADNTQDYKDSEIKDNQDNSKTIAPENADEEQIQESQDFDLHLTQSQQDSQPLLPEPDVSLLEPTAIVTYSLKPVSNPASSSTTTLLPASQTITASYSRDLSPKTVTGSTKPSSIPAASLSENTSVPLLSSELSTESITSFHFSLPPSTGEVLVASTCTTPPPMRSWQQPDSVNETPSGASTSATSSSQRPPQPSLTLSMPRQDSPDSEHVGIPLPINEPSTSTAPVVITPTMAARAVTIRPALQSMSVFERARKDVKRPRREKQNVPQDEYNPFLFSSQEAAVCPPASKRQKTKTSSEDVATNRTTSILPTERQPEPTSYVKTTKIRTIRTVTTEVKRIITIETTKQGSDEVVENLLYEEDDEPVIDEKADEKVTKEIIVETGNCTYVRQPPPVSVEEMPRISPRRKRHPSNDKPRSSKKPKRLREDAQKTVATSPPSLRRQATEETDETATNTPAAETHLTTGMRVFARWSDNFYYPGVVIGTAEFKTGRCYNVLFDDGDKRKIRPNQLIARELLEIGQSVMAQDPDGYYDPGTIVGRYSTPTDTGYEVELQKSKERKRYLQKFVILSETQVRTLVRTSSNSSRSNSGSEASKLLSSSNNSFGGLSGKSRDTSAKDTSGSSNELPRPSLQTTTTKHDKETPKSSRKAKRRVRQRRGAESSSEGSVEVRNRKQGKSVKRGLLKKPSVPTRTSPRKQSNNTPANDTIFAGFAFLITRCSNVTSDSESELQEFDRAQIVHQIEAGGGVILKDFSETQNTVADRCFLISNTYCRTVKYFQCLANGIPMVSHMWIHDCSVLNQLQDYKTYLLPAGKSLETEEVIECKTRTNLLDGLNVYLQGDTTFKTTWSSVLLAAGAHVVTKLPNRPGRAAQLDDNELCNVVISQSSILPQSLHHTCELLGIPIVGVEWLFQCLINGFVVDYDGHPKYDYKNIAENNEVI